MAEGQRDQLTQHLCASVVFRKHASTPRGDPMTKDLPQRLTLDRLPTPVGEALVVTDEAGYLRAFDWADCEAGMARLLRLHYGALRPEPGAAPAELMRRLGCYFAGEVGALTGIAWRTGG